MYSTDIKKSLKEKYHFFRIEFNYFSFSEETKYVSDNIKEEDIVKWNPKQPVFISAQTGCGKNFFLKQILVKTLHDKNIRNNKKNNILILSNRIALTRQSKKDWVSSLIDITGEDYSAQFDLYTDKGVDSRLLDFGTVVICSYQQLTEKISHLENQNFAYVVADECHFFTSDAMFNPFTHQILELLVDTFQNSVRVYMSATLEESFVPIMKAEYPNGGYYSKYYLSEKNECLYYYFERNFDYIKEICAYDKLEQLVEKIKKTRKERWIIFVSSKNDGKHLSELCSNENIESVFLTRESKDSKKDSKEYEIYKQIIEDEKFSVQVLISTSVLDNGINIKDSSVKHVVIDVLDQTEFIQMLGRVRISSDDKLNLYIRQYTDEDIEKFFIDDVKKLIKRLKIDLVPDNLRPKYFHNLLGNQTEVQRMFYLTGNSKCFTYNPCAVYKLVTRLSTFFKILKSKSNYFINSEKLGVLRDDRTELYTKYLNNANFCCPYPEFLLEPICQILELANENKPREYKLNSYFPKSDFEDEYEEEINAEELPSSMDISHAIELSFLAYVFTVLIPNTFFKVIIPPTVIEILNSNLTENDNHSDQLELNNIRNRYASLLTLSESKIPVLTEQSHWIGINNLLTSDFVYAEPITPILSDSQVIEILNLLAISYDEYSQYVDENQPKSSARKDYISFKNSTILEEKGCQKSLVNKFKNITLNEKFIDDKVVKFLSIIDWILKTNSLHFDKLEELVNKLDNEPFNLDGFFYKLKIVRGTQKDFQNFYCLFVKSNSNFES